MCTQVRVPGEVRCGKRNQMIGLKDDKYPEELPCINDLTTSLLCSPSLGVVGDTLTLSLPCFYLNKPFLDVLTHLLLCYVSNNKFYTFFTGGKDLGKNNPCWSGG